LSVAMIRALHTGLGIPSEVLLQAPGRSIKPARSLKPAARQPKTAKAAHPTPVH
jgi:hypothetical protein